MPITPKAGIQLDGDGSSFAAPAIENFASAVRPAPYSLNVNYSSTSSGDGRFEFTNQTTDFAVSDIGYGLGSTDTSPPTSPSSTSRSPPAASPSCTTSPG